jgi:hypothetical protein
LYQILFGAVIGETQKDSSHINTKIHKIISVAVSPLPDLYQENTVGHFLCQKFNTNENEQENNSNSK